MEAEASDISDVEMDNALEEEMEDVFEPEPEASTSNDVPEDIPDLSQSTSDDKAADLILSEIPARVHDKDKKEVKVVDNWTFDEKLELLKWVNIHGRDFAQVAVKMKLYKPSLSRPKNFFSPDACQFICDDLIERTKTMPDAEIFFKTVGSYTEKAHILFLRNFIEKKLVEYRALIYKYSVNSQLKASLISYFSPTTSPDLKEKIDAVFKIVYKMVKACSTFARYEDIKKTVNVCQKFISAEELENSTPEEIRKKSRIYWMENLFRSEVSAVPTVVYQPKIAKPKTSYTRSPIKSPPPRVPSKIDMQTPKIIKEKAVEPAPKRRRKSSPHKIEQRPPMMKYHETLSPITPKFEKLELEIPAIKKAPTVSEAPTISTLSMISKKLGRVDTKAYDNGHGVEVRNGGTQTLLVIVAEKSGNGEHKKRTPKSPGQKWQIFRPKTKPNATKEKTRTVACQTDPILLRADTIRWIDAPAKTGMKTPSVEVTSKVFGSCLRSYSRYIRDKKVQISFLIHEPSLTTPEIVNNRNHKCRMWFESLKNADSLHYFYNPVRFEVQKYRRQILHPMDILTIEDLMTSQAIKDKLDMVIHVALIAANGIIYNEIEEETRDFFLKTMKFMRDNALLGSK